MANAPALSSPPSCPGPHLRFFAGLWTLSGYPAPGREWTWAQKFAAIRQQGFTVVGGRFLPEAPALCREHGLDYVLYIDADASDYAEQFRRASGWNPRRINVQLCEHDTPPAAAAEAWLAMERLAAELGLEIDLEIHRDTATETPEKLAEIVERIRQVTGRPPRLCLDYSHLAVVKHLAPPYAPRLLTSPDLIPPVRQIHLRPFNGHHAQVPVTDGRGQLAPEMGPYLDFVDALFAQMRRTLTAADTVYACPETGPQAANGGGYALSCFPDVWLDTVRLRDELQARWQRSANA